MTLVTLTIPDALLIGRLLNDRFNRSGACLFVAESMSAKADFGTARTTDETVKSDREREREREATVGETSYSREYLAELPAL